MFVIVLEALPLSNSVAVEHQDLHGHQNQLLFKSFLIPLVQETAVFLVINAWGYAIHTFCIWHF